MTTNQPVTCSTSTSPPERLLPLGVLVPLLVAVTSVTLGAELAAGDARPWVRLLFRGLHATQVHRDEPGGGSSPAFVEPAGLDVDPPASREERSA